jgi:lactoylglutathione lyase
LDTDAEVRRVRARLRDRLANAQEIGVVRLAAVGRQVELVANDLPIGGFDWWGGRRPELHFEGEGTEALLRGERMLPLVVRGRVDQGASATTSGPYVGSTADGLVEVASAQYLRKRYGYRDLTLSTLGNELLDARGAGSPSVCGAGALMRSVGVSCRTSARSPTPEARVMHRGSSIGVALLPVSAFLLGSGVRSADADAASASPSPEGSEPHVTLQHVTLTVSDLQASLHFYKGVLGLEEIDAPFLPEELAFLALGDGLELHVSEVPGVEIAPMDSNHFAVTVADFDAFLARLRSEGVTYYAEDGEFTIQTRGDGVRQTYFSDPDGYWIEVNDFPGEGPR